METLNQKDLTKYEFPELERKAYRPALIGGICFTIIGVALLYVQTLCSIVGLAYLLILLGIAGVVHGIFQIFHGSKTWFYKPTNSMVQMKEYFYAADDFNALVSALERQNLDEMKKIRRQPDGNVKMVVVSSKDGRFAAAQVFRYQPFEFKPETEIIAIEENKLEAFMAMFKSKKP